MNTLETSPTPVITFIGGGTTGETAAGFKDAVEAGLVPGLDSVEVNVIVGSQDSGSRTGDLRKLKRIHAPGDYRRSISALSANSYAAPIFEHRFGEDATADDVAQAGEALLTALSYSDSSVSSERGAEIIRNTVALGQEVIEKDDKKLKGMSLGHLAIAALMVEHRTEGKGKNVQTALDEASAFMVTRGRVIADSLVPHDLEMRDGPTHLFGEDVIDNHVIENPDDVEVWVTPTDMFSSVPVNPAAADAVREATSTVIGPGSEYTSNIPALLVDGMPEVMAEAEADGKELVVVGNLDIDETVANVMTGTRYVTEIEKYAGRKCTRVVFNQNTAALPEGKAFSFDREELRKLGNYVVISADLVAAETDVTQDPNDPLTNRSKVKTNMTAAAVAALAAQSQSASFATAA